MKINKINLKKLTKEQQKIVICAGIILFVILIIVFLLTKDRKMVCTLESDQSANGYKLNTTYEVLYKGKNVKKTIIKEIITSENKDILSRFEKDWKDQYEYNKKTFGGYEYKINIYNTKISSKIVIDYSKFNLKKFSRINEAIKEYMKNDKLTIEGVEKMYTSSGAKCKR